MVLAGNNAFSSALRRILAGSGKPPSDLLFANSQDPAGRLGIEVGVFRVRGLAAPTLRDAIVRSSRPNSPGLAESRVVLGGPQVTKVVYPGGAMLYLYARDGDVYYVGTQDESLAARTLRRLR